MNARRKEIVQNATTAEYHLAEHAAYAALAKEFASRGNRSAARSCGSIARDDYYAYLRIKHIEIPGALN